MIKKQPRKNGAGSVQAKIEVTMHASPQRVWDALVHESTHWWPKTFYSSPKTKKFIIEPRLGGRVFEDYGGGEGFTWYTVNGIEKTASLQLVGYMGPPFGGPLCSILRLTLSEPAKNETKLEIADSCFGRVEDCDTEDGWREIFGEHFRVYVESAKKRRK